MVFISKTVGTRAVPFMDVLQRSCSSMSVVDEHAHDWEEVEYPNWDKAVGEKSSFELVKHCPVRLIAVGLDTT